MAKKEKGDCDRYDRPVLIGLMGVGKSSIGRRLARKLKMPLIDLDDAIVTQAGCTIPEIFARQGEAAFRAMEHAALQQAITKRAVIATGGGVVGSEDNCELLRAHPPVIWLKASPEFLADRIGGDPNRPLIASGDALQRLRELAELRDPLYQQCADLVLPRDCMKKDEIVTVITQFLRAS
ncbi:MAG: shikimate kinase [Mariprofundales bacterium]|nr:shikimate kinase [Mariprofundales bacterium]